MGLRCEITPLYTVKIVNKKQIDPLLGRVLGTERMVGRRVESEELPARYREETGGAR